jgi:hypothetical protein
MLSRKRFSYQAAAVGIVAFAPLVVACNAARIDAKSVHDTGGGRARVYSASYEQAWTAAHAAVTWNRAGAANDHAEEHYFVTDDQTYDQVGVWLLPLGTDSTKVTVVVMDQRGTGPNEEGLLRDIEIAVDRVKSGQAVDKRP